MGRFADYSDRLDAGILNPEELLADLPKVGDKLMKHAHILGDGPEMIEFGPFECTVTYVNKEHLWYEVQFSEPNINFKECYKLPETKPVILDPMVFYPADNITIRGKVTGKRRQNTNIRNH